MATQKSKRLMAELDGCLCWAYSRGKYPFDGVGKVVYPWTMSASQEECCLDWDQDGDIGPLDIAVMG